MGTTTKGLRYPEANVLGNTLHTRIKELAEDTNTQLVSRDTRLDGLDTKTTATNNSLAAIGLPIARYGGVKAPNSNIPNDSVARTIWDVYSFAYVPGNATTAIVSLSANAVCDTNAQVWWKPMFSPINGAGGDWQSLFASVDYVNVHNNGNTFINMGYAVSSIHNVSSYRGQLAGLAVNAHNDTGSGAWIHAGYMQWSVLFMS